MLRGNFFQQTDCERVPMVIVGNKSDLENERQVKTEEGKELAAKFGTPGHPVPFFETTAKNNINVEATFFEIVREIRRQPGGKGGKKKSTLRNVKGCIIL